VTMKSVWTGSAIQTFEGQVAEASLDPPDTVAEVLAAVGSSAWPIPVICTSHRNRYDLAGPDTAPLPAWMLDGLVPDEHAGHLKDGRTITLADFSRLKDVRLAMFDSVVVLAGPRAFSRLTLNSHGLARNE
jgi:hypothetical protein